MKYLLIILALAQGQTVFAQKQITGTVKDEKKQSVPATITGYDSSIIGKCDSSGRFSVTVNSDLQYLIFSAEGFEPDTQDIRVKTVLTITLKSTQTLSTFRLNAAGGPNTSLTGHTIRTEHIGQAEFKKAACCDLAGCFETQGSVQPMTTNIISNSKELRILGLSGVYNQILTDGMPMMIGLAYTYGISGIPGPMIESIFVSKGTSSVLQGFESMVGQINIIPKNPAKSEKLFFNAYVNNFGESQYNLNFRSGKSNWRNMTALHVVQPAQKWDRDKDKFLDLPQLQRYYIFDKFRFREETDKGFSMHGGIKLYKEIRSGGQWDFNPSTDAGSMQVYGQIIDFVQAEAYVKTYWRINDEKRFSFMNSAVLHDQNSWFGTVRYKGKQEQYYSNFQYESKWNNSHEFKAGLSYRNLNIRENISFSDTGLKRTYGGTYLKNESIPGLFAENIFKWRGDIITLITGIRADHHNQFGWQYTPRAMFKYDLTEKSILRASVGTGWRTVNLFAENTGLLISSRDIVFIENPDPEKSLNWGLNIFKRFTKKWMEGFFSADFYQTRFSNQFFPDYDSDPQKAIIKNFRGKTVSNGFQTDLNVKIKKKWEIKLTYNYLDVFRVDSGIKKQLPFNSKHKVLLAVSYIQKKWRADANAHYFGVQRLPETMKNPEEYRQAARSKAFTTLNIQFTRTFKKIEFYGGCENLFDFRQLKPIVSWQNPFSPYFDTSFNWGPTRGREIYLGLRIKL